MEQKLNIWDRIFNRYRKEIIEQGAENWNKYCQYTGQTIRTYSRDFVIYKIIDCVTGSEEIKKELQAL